MRSRCNNQYPLFRHAALSQHQRLDECNTLHWLSAHEICQLGSEVCPHITGNTLCSRYKPNRSMLSTGLWRWCVNKHITVTIPDIIGPPAFYLKQVSETGFCLRLQKEPTQMSPIDGATLTCHTSVRAAQPLQPECKSGTEVSCYMVVI
jgi:hypothetical protein